MWWGNRGGGIPWRQGCATHYNEQLEISCKNRAIKWLVVCYVVKLGSIKGMGLRTSAARGSGPLLRVRIAIELKYRNNL